MTVSCLQDFLESSSSQLTHHGLASLREGLRPNELAVFFRNNHFNTIFLHKGVVHILVTDQGYEFEKVWLLTWTPDLYTAASCWHAGKVHFLKTVLALGIFVCVVTKYVAYMVNACTVVVLCPYLTVDQQPEFALSLLIVTF